MHLSYQLLNFFQLIFPVLRGCMAGHASLLAPWRLDSRSAFIVYTRVKYEAVSKKKVKFLHFHFINWFLDVCALVTFKIFSIWISALVCFPVFKAVLELLQTLAMPPSFFFTYSASVNVFTVKFFFYLRGKEKSPKQCRGNREGGSAGSCHFWPTTASHSQRYTGTLL